MLMAFVRAVIPLVGNNPAPYMGGELKSVKIKHQQLISAGVFKIRCKDVPVARLMAVLPIALFVA